MDQAITLRWACGQQCLAGRSLKATAILAALGIVLLGSPINKQSARAESPPQPNVVVFLADDQGWGDLSATGNTNLATPNIDSLAREGTTLQHFYVCQVTHKELSALREAIEGQLTDGIGAGCFDGLTISTGLGVQLRFPLKPSCTQTQGTAWRPKATTEQGNKQRILPLLRNWLRSWTLPRPTQPQGDQSLMERVPPRPLASGSNRI